MRALLFTLLLATLSFAQTGGMLLTASSSDGTGSWFGLGGGWSSKSDERVPVPASASSASGGGGNLSRRRASVADGAAGDSAPQAGDSAPDGTESAVSVLDWFWGESDTENAGTEASAGGGDSPDELTAPNGEPPHGSVEEMRSPSLPQIPRGTTRAHYLNTYCASDGPDEICECVGGWVRIGNYPRGWTKYKEASQISADGVVPCNYAAFDFNPELPDEQDPSPDQSKVCQCYNRDNLWDIPKGEHMMLFQIADPVPRLSTGFQDKLKAKLEGVRDNLEKESGEKNKQAWISAAGAVAGISAGLAFGHVAAAAGGVYVLVGSAGAAYTAGATTRAGGRIALDTMDQDRPVFDAREAAFSMGAGLATGGLLHAGGAEGAGALHDLGHGVLSEAVEHAAHHFHHSSHHSMRAGSDRLVVTEHGLLRVPENELGGMGVRVTATGTGEFTGEGGGIPEQVPAVQASRATLGQILYFYLYGGGQDRDAMRNNLRDLKLSPALAVLEGQLETLRREETNNILMHREHIADFAARAPITIYDNPLPDAIAISWLSTLTPHVIVDFWDPPNGRCHIIWPFTSHNYKEGWLHVNEIKENREGMTAQEFLDRNLHFGGVLFSDQPQDVSFDQLNLAVAESILANIWLPNLVHVMRYIRKPGQRFHPCVQPGQSKRKDGKTNNGVSTALVCRCMRPKWNEGFEHWYIEGYNHQQHGWPIIGVDIDFCLRGQRCIPGPGNVNPRCEWPTQVGKWDEDGKAAMSFIAQEAAEDLPNCHGQILLLDVCNQCKNKPGTECLRETGRGVCEEMPPLTASQEASMTELIHQFGVTFDFLFNRNHPSESLYTCRNEFDKEQEKKRELIMRARQDEIRRQQEAEKIAIQEHARQAEVLYQSELKEARDQEANGFLFDGNDHVELGENPRLRLQRQTHRVSVAKNSEKTDISWPRQIMILFGSLIALYLCWTVFVKTDNPAKKPLLKEGNQGLV